MNIRDGNLMKLNRLPGLMISHGLEVLWSIVIENNVLRDIWKMDNLLKLHPSSKPPHKSY